MSIQFNRPYSLSSNAIKELYKDQEGGIRVCVLIMAVSPNGFTESRQVNDFLSVITRSFFMSERRRWLTAEGRNIILDRYSLLADNTSYSKEFADVLKNIWIPTR